MHDLPTCLRTDASLFISLTSRLFLFSLPYVPHSACVVLSPAAINVATTWDTSLIYKRGRAMGEEHRGKGVNVALGPMTNLGRVAAGGRNWEGERS